MKFLKLVISLISVAMIVTSIVVFVSTLNRAVGVKGVDDNDKFNENISSNIEVSVSKPERLIIPSLKIDTEVTEIGITNEGFMDTPKSFYKVGWYKLGPAPGERGGSVIVGHLNNGLGLAGIFQNLYKLKAGDEIHVVDRRNRRLVFQVTSKRTFSYDSSMENIFAESSKQRLSLITCGGAWIRSKQTYADRLVVFSELKRVELLNT